MSIVTELKYTANLDKGVCMTPITPSFMGGDQEAHRFVIDCYRQNSREAVDLSGVGVSAYFIRQDGKTVLLDGKTDGNKVSVLLSAACYAVMGRFSLVIKLSLDDGTADSINTVFWGEGAVSRSRTDVAIDPDSVIPSLEELLAQIDAMEKATAAANEAAASVEGFKAEINGQVSQLASEVVEANSSIKALVGLPSGYQAIEYLESTGEQAIVTTLENNKMNQDSRVVVKFAQTPDGVNVTNYLFGSRNSTSQNGFYITIRADGGIEYGYNKMRETDAFIKDTNIHTIDCNKRELYLDGVLVYTAPESTFETPSNCRIFAIRGANSELYYYGKHRIYAYEEYANDELICNMTPCIRLSDGVCGMYDSVNNRFATNEKTGTFAHGNEVNIPALNNSLVMLQSSVAEAKSDIDEINGKLDGKGYIGAEADRVADKVRNVQTGDTITFAAVSDMHYSVDNPTIREALADMRNGIKAIAKQVKLDFYACFGDVIYRLSTDGDFDKGKAEMIGATKLLNDAFGIAPQIRMVGNHDPNAQGETGYFTVDQLNAFTGIYNDMLGKPDDLRNRGYGYLDFETQKIRLIVLNTSYYNDSNGPNQGQTQYSFQDYQGLLLCQWMDLSEKQDAEDWQIVVMSHIALDSTTRAPQIGKYSAILDAYFAGGSWTGGSYSYDFAGKNTAKLALYINGHYHAYQAKNMRNVNASGEVLNTLPMANLYVINALPGRDEESLFGITYTKTAGTAESTAFQIITLNPVKKIVYAHHYGAGIDIVMHYDPSTTTNLETHLTQPVWASVDGSIATVADGVVTPVSGGNVIIMAKSEADGCIECWNFLSVI